MTESDSMGGSGCRSLIWGLDRLCLWGELDGVESADPHVRGEAAASAKVTIQQLAREFERKQSSTTSQD